METRRSRTEVPCGLLQSLQPNAAATSISLLIPNSLVIQARTLWSKLLEDKAFCHVTLYRQAQRH